MKIRSTKGMTLFELLLMVVILAVIAVLAVPSYMDFLKKSEFSGTADLAEVIKNDVMTCVKEQQGQVAGCTSGKQGIPVAVMPTKTLPGVSVIDGVITATAPLEDKYGSSGKTFILTPVMQNGDRLQWKMTGSACHGGYVEC